MGRRSQAGASPAPTISANGPASPCGPPLTLSSGAVLPPKGRQAGKPECRPPKRVGRARRSQSIIWHCALRPNALQRSSQCSAAQFSAVRMQWSSVQCSAKSFSAVQRVRSGREPSAQPPASVSGACSQPAARTNWGPPSSPSWPSSASSPSSPKSIPNWALEERAPSRASQAHAKAKSPPSKVPDSQP